MTEDLTARTTALTTILNDAGLGFAGTVLAALIDRAEGADAEVLLEASEEWVIAGCPPDKFPPGTLADAMVALGVMPKPARAAKSPLRLKAVHF